MFNRPHPSKRAKSWRPEPGLLSKSSSRGFASTRWGAADDGFLVDDIKRTKDGFALDEYAQVPLSPQAIQALKRLKAMEPDENVIIADEVIEAPETFQIETWNANAHLPFVVDAYDFDDDGIEENEALVDHANDVEVIETKEDQAEPFADAVQTVEAKDKVTEVSEQPVLPQAEHADTPVSEAKADAPTDNDAGIEVADSEAESKAEARAEADVDAEAETKVEAEKQDTVIDAKPDDESASEEDGESLVQEAAQETAQDSDQDLDQEPTQKPTEQPAEAPTETRIEAQAENSAETDLVESDLNAEEDVAPEKMAASLDDVVDDVTLPEPVLNGIDPEEAAQREAEKFAEGLAQGIEQGERQAREAMQQEVNAQCTVLAGVTQELHALLKDSKVFYDPLKRLAMHLAEQIVMGELKTSTQAIEQLIQRCLDELDHPAQGLVVIELNPDDKTRLQAQNPELIKGMRLEAVHDMQPGSVRLFANDTVVEDLIEHRLQTLAQSMLVDVASWQAQSAFTKPQESTEDLESEDVHP